MPRRANTPIASWVPLGLGRPKPNHYWEMLRIAWQNRDNLAYAWRILAHGVCDGCSLGPRGLRDDAMPGTHLCLVRLNMLRASTMPALDVRQLAEVAELARLDGKQLRELGRLPYPMLRRRGEKGFTRITWDEAFSLLGRRLREAAARDPDRIAIYTTSRGLTNETYYVAQKAARLLGTNNIDNAARLCHAASTVALKRTLGVGASTCSYTDWIGADLIVLLGSDIANNQPVAMKYFYLAKQRRARIAVINPYREPGLENYWVPSITKSALFGTKFADEFFQVRVGGDIAFLNGVLKWLLHFDQTNAPGHAWLDHNFIEQHTSGWPELCAAIDAQSWEQLEAESGVIRDVMRRFAEMYAAAGSAVFIWSMGLTQHRFGVQNVEAVVNLALARGMLGRPNTGLVPIRGHSGVQGAAECGSVPNAFPGGYAVNEENARRFAELWGAPVPSRPGLSAPEMLEAAHDGKLDVLWCAGGNFLDTMPEPARMRAALERVPLRVHQDLFLNSSMLVEPLEEVLLLPGQTRYEQRGGGTLTSTERRIRYSPEIPGPRIGEAMCEWEIFSRAAQAALPEDLRGRMQFAGGDAVRAEMERAMPMYAGIATLKKEGDAVQYGGARLCAGGVCPGLANGRARFTPLALPDLGEPLPPEVTSEEAARAMQLGAVPARREFYLTTRRGKQFNSMIWDTRDALTGAGRRDAIFISAEDAGRLGLRAGDAVALRAAAPSGEATAAEFRGVCVVAPLAPGTLQAYWPEANVLLPRRLDPQSHEPDYNAWVTLAPLQG